MHRYVRKGLKYFSLAAFSMLLALFAALFYLLATTSGLKALISASNSYLSDIVEISGEIKDGSVLDGFETASPLCVDVKDTVIVRADSFKIGYSVLGYLVTDVFRVGSIDADRLEVILTYKGQDEEEAYESGSEENSGDDDEFVLNFPVRIEVDELRLKDFAYLSDIVDVRVKNGSLKLEASGDTARIIQGHTDDVDVHLKYESSDDETEQSNTVRTFDDGQGQIEKLYTVKLPLAAAISNLAICRGRYHMDGYDTGVFYAHVNAEWKDTLLRVDSVRASHPLGNVSVRGTMDFTGFYTMDFAIEGNGQPNYYNLTHYDGALHSLRAKGRLYGDLVDLNLKAMLDSPSAVDIEARLNTLSSLLPASLSVNSERISYPLNEKLFARNPKLNFKDHDVNNIYEYYLVLAKELSPSVREDRFTRSRSYLSDVKLTLNGHILDIMQVDFSGILNGFGFKNLHLAVNSDSSLTSSQINSFTLKGISGSREFNGSVSGLVTYDDNLSFSGSASMSTDDLGGITEYLDGEFFLDVKGEASFSRNDESYAVCIEDLSSAFSLLGRKTEFSLNSFRAGSSEPVSFDYLSVTQQENSVVLKSSSKEDSLFEGSCVLNDLASLYPGIDGAFSGKFNVSGQKDAPVISVVGKSDVLTFRDAVFSKVVLDFNLDMEKQSFSNTVIADSLRLPKMHRFYSSCSLDAGGSLKQHSLVLSCGKDDGSFASASGSYDRESSTYSAKLSNLVFVSNIFDTVHLDGPVLFEYDMKTKDGRFTDVTLTDGKAKLIVSNGTIGAGSFSSLFKVENLNLNIITKLFPEKYNIRGTLNGGGSYRFEKGVSFIDSELNASRGILSADRFVLPYSSAKLKLKSNEHSVDSQFSLDLAGNLGTLRLEASVSDFLAAKKLSGTIDLNDFNLSLLSTLSSSLNTVSGRANIHGSLGGTLAHPLLFGRVSAEGEINPPVNVGYIDKFSVNLNAEGDRGSVDGYVSLNQTKGFVNGSLNWADSPKGQLTLKAEDLPVFLMGKGVAYTDISASADFDENISLNGDVYVKSAQIKFKSLDSPSVSPSPDEIFVKEDSNLYTEARKLQLDSSLLNDSISIGVRLSDDIRVDSMGVKGRLVGNVDISKKAGERRLRSEGKVSLADGRAQLYGHKFIINRADSIFKDDIDNPLLDAEIICDPSYVEDSVVAGVKVTGRAKDPAIRLFSNPAMSQNEILSYILYGHGLEKTSDNNSDRSSTQFLTALGLGTTSGLLNAFVGVFGMDGVQIGSSGSGNDSQVEVQTYITNKVRLSYGYGIFNSVQEFKLRYEIMSRLYAEVASSIDNSIDLIYSFESD